MRILNLINGRRLEHAAGEAAGAGGGGAAGDTGAGAGGAASPAGGSAGGTVAPAGGAAAASALSSAPAAAIAAGGIPDPLAWLQPKFQVKDAAGKVDEAASARKQAEAYGPLVKRLGTDELPPAAATDYKITAPKDVEAAAFEAFTKDPATVAALDKFHKAGLTNSQVDMAMGMYLEAAKQLAAGAPALTAEQTVAELGKEWKTEADLTKNIGAARHVATVLGQRVGMDFAAIETSGLANNAAFIRIMASLAPEFAEDRPPGGTTLPITDLESLTKSPAYMDAKHPDHASVKARVDAHFAALPGGNQKPKGPFTINL